MERPSTRGAFSTTAQSVSWSAKSVRICALAFICAISRPRKRSVIFTRLPLVRNLRAAFTLVVRSFVSILGESLISLISTTCCLRLASFSLRLSQAQRVSGRHNSQLLSFSGDHTHFSVSNPLINEQIVSVPVSIIYFHSLHTLWRNKKQWRKAPLSRSYSQFLLPCAAPASCGLPLLRESKSAFAAAMRKTKKI